MKDEKAKTNISDLWGEVLRLRTKLDAVELVVNNLRVKLEYATGLIKVRYCDKCKHETIQCKATTFLLPFLAPPHDYDFMCLVCGTKWNCENKNVCTEIK